VTSTRILSGRRVPVHVWIPPKFTANPKITIERADGTVDDITDILLNWSVEDGVTEGIGNFEFEIPNPNETYSNVWTGMEIFRFYCDYASTPTTLRFRGRAEKVSKQNNNVRVTGRSESLFVQDQNVNKDYTTQDAGVIIKDLFDSYGQSRYDTTEINTSVGTTLTLSFLDVPFWEVIESVCTAVNYDCYVSPGLVVKFFEAGTAINTTDALVHDHNMIEVGDFAEDLQFVKNKVRVIGGEIDGVRVRYTAKDETSQTNYGIRMETINDDGIVTLASAKELAEFIKDQKKDPPVVGDVKGILLATIQPGESMKLSSPMENLQPQNYRIISYKHLGDQEGLFTTVTINKESKRVSHIIKDRIQKEHRRTGSSTNTDDLDYAEIELFNVDVGSHSNTEVVEGVLNLKSGQAAGNWISGAYGPDDGRIVSKIKIDLIGDNIPEVVIGVSTDGGSNYTTVSRNELLTSGLGVSIIVKLSLVTGVRIDSLLVQYSMTT